jgi:hypothetical protein
MHDHLAILLDFHEVESQDVPVPFGDVETDRFVWACQGQTFGFHHSRHSHFVSELEIKLVWKRGHGGLESCADHGEAVDCIIVLVFE